MTAAVNVESIKLQLIRNRALHHPGNGSQGADFVFNKEAIQKLVKALEFSDAELSGQIETFLSKVGEEAVPEIMEGLLSKNTNVKSVCAMALIRIGRIVGGKLQALYARHQHCEDARWVLTFVLSELGETVVDEDRSERPLEAQIDWEPQVRVLERVG